MNLVRHEGSSAVEFSDRSEDHERFTPCTTRLSRPVANITSATHALPPRLKVSACEDTFRDYIRRALALRSLSRVDCFMRVDFGERININGSEFYGRKT